MSDLFTPKIGTFLECGMPYTGLGAVVSVEPRRNEEGHAVTRTSILWYRNGVSEVDDLWIATDDRNWRIVRKLSRSELGAARAKFEEISSAVRDRDERSGFAENGEI